MLNRDILLKIIQNIKKNMSLEELEEEIRLRKESLKCEMLKQSLLNLKVVPSLKTFIEKYENFIKNVKDIDEFLEGGFKEEAEELNIATHGESIYYDISEFNYQNYDDLRDDWVFSDKIECVLCPSCNYYEILTYRKERLKNLYKNYGTSHACPKHLDF